MATVDEILATMAEIETNDAIDELLVIDANTRQINIPGSELIFGVAADAQSERKYFYCPRNVGNNLDMAAAFIRVNYRNANGEIDSHLIDDVALTDDGEAITFSWEIAPETVAYRGLVTFVVDACFVGPDGTVLNRWHTTQASGNVLDGLEPTNVDVTGGTSDVVTQLVAMVEKQTTAVENTGATQTAAVEAAAKAAESAAVAEIEAKGTNTLASIPNDYTAIQSAVDALAKNTAPGIVCSAAGTSVVVTDASDQALAGLRIFGKSTQDGTPTPEAPVEIKSVVNPTVTVCGRNLLELVGNNVTWNGITFTVDTANGTITVNGTATGLTYTNFTTTLPKGAYHFDGCPTGGNTSTGYFIRVISTDLVSGVENSEGDDIGSGADFVLENPSTITIRIAVRPGVVTNAVVFKPMLRFTPGVDKSFEPYSGQTVELTHSLLGIPVTSGGNYTDSDGQQWICDEVDLERGVYVQRLGVIENYAGEAISDQFMATTGELITGATVQYILATTIETPLTEAEMAAYRKLHTNKPNTTVLNDAGAWMSVDYVADTKLYIDHKIAALAGSV